VDERQSLETLTRDQKTIHRTLAKLTEQQTELVQKKEGLVEDARTQEIKEHEVRSMDSKSVHPHMFSTQLENKLASFRHDLTKTKQNLDNIQSERARITYVYLLFLLLPYSSYAPPCRQLEKEANERLYDVYQKMLQAGVDKNESEREAKLKDALVSLQRIFPGKRIPDVLRRC